MHGQQNIKSITKPMVFVVSGFRREVDENCTLLGHYAASGGNLRVVVRKYHYSLRTNQEERNSASPVV